jgi:glycosyltransferase involved in cell wall biosynthesis
MQLFNNFPPDYKKMHPRISVIIPCYNQGHFLREALESVDQANSPLLEVIIVNDGSTDAATNDYCRQLHAQGHHVVFQENKGLSGARNTGILLARGDYILPLDADNKIRPGYITESIRVMDLHDSVAVVYGNAQYFGERHDLWKPGKFNLQKLMLSNTIDACAVIRKKVLLELGLYDESMRWGWEDWELWLRIAFKGYEFWYIDEVLFDYRVLNSSMSKTLYRNYEKPNAIENYVHQKHPSGMGHSWIVEQYVKRFKQNPILFMTKLFLRAYFPRYYQKLLEKNKIRNGL